MMNKQDYLDALQRALAGLPPDLVAKTLDYYEQTFIEGAAAGRSEQEVADDLGDPKKIAMTLRANTHRQVFEHRKTPVNLLRLLVSLVGLAIFNLFMVVPAAVYAALLATLYAVGLSFYLAGIAITASGLSGANELVLDGPMRHIFIQDHARRRQAVETALEQAMRGIGHALQLLAARGRQLDQRHAPVFRRNRCRHQAVGLHAVDDLGGGGQLGHRMHRDVRHAAHALLLQDGQHAPGREVAVHHLEHPLHLVRVERVHARNPVERPVGPVKFVF